ncbi:MAG: outer membrane protein assembly factor BamA, partial [Syntrophales bacterium]|nr:outer membrane protein assembly factor BamA [Syntrophales bacterium]
MAVDAMTQGRLCKTIRAMGVFCLVLAYGIGPLFAVETPKLAVMPFAAHSQTNAAFLQEALLDALTKELRKSKGVEVIDKEIILPLLKEGVPTETTGREIARSLGATHTVMGSITELGERISVDAKVFDLATGKPFPALFVQGRGLGSIPELAAQLRGDILMKISARQRIAKINFQGNQRIESAAINQVLKSTQGSSYSEAAVAEDIKAIYRLGYFDDVAVDVVDTPEGKVLTYLLKEKGLIVDIRIKGNKVVDGADIEGALSFKTKQTLSQEKIVSSVEKIKALYDNKGYFNAEIGYKIEKVGEKDIRVVFDIKENEKLYIKTITFTGNHTFDDKELKNIMTTTEQGFFYFLTDSGVLKKDQLKQDVGKINAFYLNHGFIKAQVGEPEVTFDKRGIYIKIPITEGKRFTVGKVSLGGDKLETPKEKLMENLKINKKSFFDREAIIKDIEMLTQACHDEGYAYAEVNTRTNIDEEHQSVDITYDIFKGHLVYFNRITITGNTKTRDKVIRRMLSVAEGDLYNSTKLKNSYRSLEQLRYFEEIDFQSQKGPDEFLTDVNIRVKEKPTGMISIGAGYSALEQA